ncbi:MAG: AMP-binding protein [Burkholderiales bacterium]|nr:AMP-binding protein [Burkholderiales bacterium]
MNAFVDKACGPALAHLAERFGDRQALKYQGRSWTFREVKGEVDRASARLVSLGLQPGDKVAVWMPNRPEYLWVWLGAAQIGLVAVLLNTRLKRDEITYQLRQSEAAAVVVPGPGAFRDFLGDLRAICPEAAAGTLRAGGCAALPSLRHVVCVDAAGPGAVSPIEWSRIAASDAPLRYVTDVDQPAQIAYSSGTTALPKGALLTHRMWRKAADHGGRFMQTAEDRLYLCVPLFGILANVNGVLTFWSRGSCVVLAERFEAEVALTDLAAERCTVTYLLPIMVEQMLAHPRFREFDLSALRTGLVATNNPAILEAAVTRFGMREMFASYGMTETSSAVTRTFATEPLEVRINTQGRPLPDIEVRIADPETGAAVGPGVVGEIQVRGYPVTPGYYNDPAATRAAFTADGWFKTGDAGSLRADGNLQFAQRLRDGYKHNGFNVATAEVEFALIQHPDIEAAAVLGMPDGAHGEVGVAFVVMRGGAPLDAGAVVAFLEPRLASYKLPRHVFAVDELPLTGGTGRVQKFRLKAQAAELIARVPAARHGHGND